MQNEREVLSKVLFTKNMDKYSAANQDAESSEDESLDPVDEEAQFDDDANADEEQQLIKLDKSMDIVFEYITSKTLSSFSLFPFPIFSCKTCSHAFSQART